MTVCAIVPMKSLVNIKQRLSGVLNQSQRQAFSIKMLADVAHAIRLCGKIEETFLVSVDDEVLRMSKVFGLTPIKEKTEGGVNAAVSFVEQYCVRKSFTSSMVVPTDLPLITPEDLSSMANLGRTKRCVVISPSRRLDGTNLLFRNPPDAIQTSYEHDSFNSHWRIALESNCRVKVYSSPSAGLDKIGRASCRERV